MIDMFSTGTLSCNTMTWSDLRVDSAEYELSATECAPTYLSLSPISAEFSTTAYINTDLLNQMVGKPSYENLGCSWLSDRLIMIQARWHKKARIRKKWLKRYGMKYDIVVVKYVGETANLDTMSGSWDVYVDRSKTEYLWRPHQLRREIKIEWVSGGHK